MRFRPAPLPSVAALVALIILVNLSLWQLRRHHAAQERLAEVEAQLYGAPVTTDDFDPTDDHTWRKASFQGRFLTSVEPALLAGRFEFGEPGFDVIQPFALDSGPTVLVNRGWIPANDWQTHLDAIVPPPSPTTVQGLLLAVDGNPDLTPLPASEGQPERWTMELGGVAGCNTSIIGAPYAAIRASWDALDPAPWVVVVGPALTRGQAKQPTPLPVSGYVATPKQIGHLEYSIQWGLIALTLLAVWAYAGVRRGERLAQGAADDADDADDA